MVGVATPTKPVCDTCGIDNSVIQPLKWLLQKSGYGNNVAGVMYLYMAYWKDYSKELDQKDGDSDAKLAELIKQKTGGTPDDSTISALKDLLYYNNKCIEDFFYNNDGCVPPKSGQDNGQTFKHAGALAVFGASSPIRPVCETCYINDNIVEPLEWLLQRGGYSRSVDGAMALAIGCAKNADMPASLSELVQSKFNTIPDDDTLRALYYVLFDQTQCIREAVLINEGCIPPGEDDIPIDD
ncbi:hypothetical protein H4R18_001647 [Coemansia javaensis]|uniref:Uncharacterized protein n=1 Tax=Coemansia javaensis TaxID=2761396 RepID=A0A9W8HKT9_9FUNG|nr:hypothetical protein H4R18_001647 [Coemansia javaensis]